MAGSRSSIAPVRQKENHVSMRCVHPGHSVRETKGATSCSPPSRIFITSFDLTTYIPTCLGNARDLFVQAGLALEPYDSRPLLPPRGWAGGQAPSPHTHRHYILYSYHGLIAVPN
jgi:hypothetical protein